MIDIKKAEASRAEVDPPLRDTAPTESEVASSCAAEIRQNNKTESDLGGVVHGGDVNAAASDRVRQIEQIDDEIRRAVEPGAIEYVPVGALKPDPHNARKHPESQIDLLAASIRQFGFVGAIIVDEGNVIISGHGRHEAAKRDGMDVVPCIRVTHLTAKAKIALALADNRLGELSAWDELALTSQLEQLLTPDLDFDFEVTGFDTVDADRLLGPEPDPLGRKSGTGEFSMDPDDNVPRLETEGPSVSQPGDMWDLGTHRVLHGDALDPRSYEVLLGDEVATQIVTDPPYNVPNRGHVSSRPFREFAMAAGEMSPKEFRGFLARAFSLAAGTARDGAIFHVFMDWHHLGEMQTAINDAGLEVKNLCVWAKPSPGMGSFYRSQHELVFVLKHGTAKHINNFGLGARGRNQVEYLAVSSRARRSSGCERSRWWTPHRQARRTDHGCDPRLLQAPRYHSRSLWRQRHDAHRRRTRWPPRSPDRDRRPLCRPDHPSLAGGREALGDPCIRWSALR